VRRKPVTAAELSARLEKSPEHQALVALREERLRTFAATFQQEEDAIAAEVAQAGYAISSVWDFVNNTPHPLLSRPFTGPYERAYPILVRHLRVPHHERVREGIIRALTVKDGGPQVADALLAEFVSEQNQSLRWVLANALKHAMPLKQRKQHPEIALVHQRKSAL
jgi:hypothetical protein